MKGIWQGAVVTITGSQSDSLASVTYNSGNPEAWVPITGQPVVGEYIIVEQSINGVSSGEPALSGTDIVQPVPDPLPIPAITQPLHTCSDFIVLDNLIPGGEIMVQVNGITFAQGQIERTLQEFLLNPNIPIAVGDIFKVWQTVTVPGKTPVTLQSDATHSLAVENLKLSNPLPEPGIQPQPVACTADATFDNLIVGSYLNWSNAGDVWWVDSVDRATEEWNWGGPALQTGPITAQQSFNRCSLASPVFTGTVLPAPPLTAPVVADGLCTQVTKFHVSGLNTPCTLFIYATLPSGNTTIMEGRKFAASDAEMDVPIPADWYGQSPASFQFQQTTACGASPESKPLTLKTLSSISTPVLVSPIYECSHFIHIQQATPDCMMYVRTGDWAMMSDNFTVAQADFFLHTDALYEPLYKTEVLVLTEWGCAVHAESTPVTVTPAPLVSLAPPKPTITSILRPGQTTVGVDGVIPGAIVSLLVNGENFAPNFVPWAPPVEALSTSVTLTMSQPLVAGQILIPIQQMCGNFSTATNTTGVTVQKATLKVMPSPTAVTKGTTANLVVQAVDTQTNEVDDSNWGSVSWDGQTFKLGHAISQPISATDSRSSIMGTIAATPYNDAASFTIQLLAAPPPTFTFQVSGGPISFPVSNPQTDANETIILSSITWTVKPLWAPTQQVSLTGVTNTDYKVASHAFTKPPLSARGVTDFLEVTGTATFNVLGSLETVSLSGQLERDPADTSAKNCMAWLLSWNYDENGNIVWSNGQTGSGPITPFGLSC